MARTTVALDTETWQLSSLGHLVPRLVCVSLSQDGVTSMLLHRQHAEPFITDLLADSDVLIVGHNIAYDLAVLGQTYPALQPLIWAAYEANRICDTGIADQLEHIAAGDFRIHRYSLAHLVKRHLDIDMTGKSDGWRLSYHLLDDVTDVGLWPAEASRYARHDAILTWRVWDAVRFVLPTYHVHVRAAWALHLMSAWGMRADTTRVGILQESIETKIVVESQVLHEAGILRPNGKIDTKQVQQHVVRAGITDTTPTGRPITNDRTLATIDHPAIQSLRRFRKAQKIQTTYLPVLTQATKTAVCPRYRVLVDSGRTSCSKPNIQNQPRAGGVRAAWTPRPGYRYMAADYAAAELSALAEVCIVLFGFSTLGMEIKAGIDPHLSMACRLLGIKYSDASRRIAAGDAEVKKTRTLAKAANFGFAGFLSPQTFCEFALGYGLTVSISESHQLRQNWLAHYTEMVPFFRAISARCRAGATTIVHPLCGFRRGGLFAPAAANTMFQTPIAIGAKRSLFEVARRCWHDVSDPMYGCRPVAFVHDEILLEVPINAVTLDVARSLKTAMESEMQQVLRQVPCRVEISYGDQWTKTMAALEQ